MRMERHGTMGFRVKNMIMRSRSKLLLASIFLVIIYLLRIFFTQDPGMIDVHDMHESVSVFYHDADCRAYRGMAEADTAMRRLLDGGKRTHNSIPYIVHQTYSSSSIPSDYVPYLMTLLQNIGELKHELTSVDNRGPKLTQQRSINSSFRYAFWTDAAIHNFVKAEYPELTALFDSYSHALERADAARYLILLHFGGVYIDMDVEITRRPLRDLLFHNHYGCILAQDLPVLVSYLWKRSRSVTNAFIACAPNSTLMRHVVDTLRSFSAVVPFHPDNIVYRTGPFVLDSAVRDLLEDFVTAKRRGKAGVDDRPDFLISPPSWFVGQIDSKHFEGVRQACIASLRHSTSSFGRSIDRIGSFFSDSFQSYVANTEQLKHACIAFLRETNQLPCGSATGKIHRSADSTEPTVEERCARLLEQAQNKQFAAPHFAFGRHKYLNVGYLNGSVPNGSKLVNIEPFLSQHGVDYLFPYSS